MSPVNISQDDILDISELTMRLEAAISEILKDNERQLALSALFSAFINSIVHQAKSIEEIAAYTHAVHEIMNRVMQDLKSKAENS